MQMDDRHGRDAAGIGPYAREREHLTSLSSLGAWKVSEGEPDIRGWEIRTVAGRQLGAVADLLIDADAGEVVMLDVDLPGTDRHTFVPIRVVHIDRVKRVVLMDSADLPDSDLDRASGSRVPGRTAADTGVVRYPRSDREVVVDRSALADAPPRDAIAEERRQGDRRHIDRLSTDL
jgi:hypothetical protein